MEDAKWDKLKADTIRAGKCPFDELKPGQTMAHCPLGFPGCECAYEIEHNQYLYDMQEKLVESYSEYMKSRPEDS